MHGMISITMQLYIHFFAAELGFDKFQLPCTYVGLAYEAALTCQACVRGAPNSDGLWLFL